MDFQNLLVDRQPDGVWIVALNRPEKRNALNAETIEELVALFSDAMNAGVRSPTTAQDILKGSGLPPRR